MTCQCTCGKHILIDISQSNTAAAAGQPITVLPLNATGTRTIADDLAQWADFGNAAAGGRSIPF